ncbi:hypothetical protein B0H14DRAFT_2598797 [Mycena olivaceomarginata]|nr:hypothetical protein B0H14DRAFT_2598797 [Mycena olivaceomarginata]
MDKGGSGEYVCGPGRKYDKRDKDGGKGLRGERERDVEEWEWAGCTKVKGRAGRNDTNAQCACADAQRMVRRTTLLQIELLSRPPFLPPNENEATKYSRNVNRPLLHRLCGLPLVPVNVPALSVCVRIHVNHLHIVPGARAARTCKGGHTRSRNTKVYSGGKIGVEGNTVRRGEQSPEVKSPERYSLYLNRKQRRTVRGRRSGTRSRSGRILGEGMKGRELGWVGSTLSSTVGSSVSTLTTTLSGTFWLTLLSLPKLFGALSGLPAFIWSFVAAPLVSLPVPDHKMAAIRQTLLTTARLTRTGHIAYILPDPNHFQKYDRLCAAFFAKRDRLGYSGDGPGLIYIVASFKKPDGVPLFKKPDAVALGPDTMRFLAQLNIKGGLTQPDRMERRRTEYRKCEEDNTHVWICTYEVSRRLYCERLLHLTLLRDGATRDRTPCKCGVSHREYFNFLSIGGLSQLHATTVSVLKLIGEPIRRKSFPPSDDTKAVYDLIRAT